MRSVYFSAAYQAAGLNNLLQQARMISVVTLNRRSALAGVAGMPRYLVLPSLRSRPP